MYSAIRDSNCAIFPWLRTLQRTIRIELATSKYKVIHLDLVNRTAVALHVDDWAGSRCQAPAQDAAGC